MTKTKNTKRALFTSVLSMMLCVAMLIGSTFAWFTDNVTSGKNRIVAGNLDVELKYNNASTNGWADASKESVAEPNFFVDKEGKAILWEPGVMAVTQFKVANGGSLALKYSLATLKADFNSLAGHDLSEVIKFAVIDNANYTDTATRESILALNPEFKDFTGFTAQGHLLPADKATDEEPSEQTFTVVAYWAPNTNDNLYNVNNGQKTDDNAAQLYINIEIQLVASQYNFEKDSFNENYDQNAEYPVIKSTEDSKAWYKAGENNLTIKNGNELAYLAELVNAGTDDFAGKTITLANDVVLPVGDWVAIGTYEKPFKGTFNGSDHAVSNVVIHDNDGTKVGGFFGAIEDAVIQNLTVSGEMTLGGAQAANMDAYAGNGGICAYANNSRIESCTNEINIDASNRSTENSALVLGGILGFGDSTTIKDCTNRGNITAPENTLAGGISSTNNNFGGGTSVTLTGNNTNSGNITGTEGMVGDLLGFDISSLG